jgi:hypothetical protein
MQSKDVYNIEKAPVFEWWVSREQKKNDAHRGITGHSRGCGKANVSVPPQNTAQPLQEASSEAQEHLKSSWQMVDGLFLKLASPNLFLTVVANIDPGVAELLADGTYCYFCSAVLCDSIINRMVRQTNICDTLKFARWVRHYATFLTTFMAANYKIKRWDDL